jgi:hypothetical protein
LDELARHFRGGAVSGSWLIGPVFAFPVASKRIVLSRRGTGRRRVVGRLIGRTRRAASVVVMMVVAAIGSMTGIVSFRRNMPMRPILLQPIRPLRQIVINPPIDLGAG